jgi:hypothetical protein
MQNKLLAGCERRDFRQPRPSLLGRQHSIRIAQAERDLFERRSSVMPVNEAVRIRQGGARNAGQRISLLEALHDPALEPFPGGTRRRLGLFPQRTAHRK